MKLDEAFLILSAHFAQTREDKFEAQVRNSFSFEDRISLRGPPGLDVVNKFSEEMYVPFFLKFTLHIRQKSEASTSRLGFLPLPLRTTFFFYVFSFMKKNTRSIYLFAANPWGYSARQIEAELLVIK